MDAFLREVTLILFLLIMELLQLKFATLVILGMLLLAMMEK
jgi:hypothetical protein